MSKLQKLMRSCEILSGDGIVLHLYSDNSGYISNSELDDDVLDYNGVLMQWDDNTELDRLNKICAYIVFLETGYDNVDAAYSNITQQSESECCDCETACACEEGECLNTTLPALELSRIQENECLVLFNDAACSLYDNKSKTSYSFKNLQEAVSFLAKRAKKSPMDEVMRNVMGDY